MSMDAYDAYRLKEEMQQDIQAAVVLRASLDTKERLIDHARNQLVAHHVQELVDMGLTLPELEQLCVQAKLTGQ